MGTQPGAVELDPFRTEQDVAVHGPGLLVTTAAFVVRRRAHFPLEIEADREPFADLAPVRVAGRIEAHTERFETVRPMLERRFARVLRPESLGANLERVAPRQRHLVIAHHDRPRPTGHDHIGPVPRNAGVRVEREAHEPAEAVVTCEIDVPPLVPGRFAPRRVAALVAPVHAIWG